MLLPLLKVLCSNEFNDILLEPLRICSLEPRNIEKFSKFSLKTIERINPCPSIVILKEPCQIPLPFDPFVFIEIEVSCEK